MTANRLILHIGAPKCGSTALQSAFSQHDAFASSGGEEFRYATIDGHGRFHTGVAVRRRAARSLSGGARSASASRIGAISDTAKAALAAHMNESRAQTSIILSNEGWMSKPDEFAALGLLNAAGPVEVIAYVRPQIDYLNAAWWQWGAWAGVPFDDWMARHLEECRWGSLLDAWRRLPNTGAIIVRLLPADVVGDFFTLLACTPPEGRVANRSLPEEALRFMQANPQLRAGPHDSSMPFVLGRALPDGGGTPWVLPLAFVAQVIKSFQADNRVLQSMLDPESQAHMEADARWWSSDAYAGKTLAPRQAQAVAAETSEALAVAFAKRLLELERELAALKARQAR